MGSTACGPESNKWRLNPMRQSLQTLPLVRRVMDKTLSYVVTVLLVVMSGTDMGLLK